MVREAGVRPSLGASGGSSTPISAPVRRGERKSAVYERGPNL